MDNKQFNIQIDNIQTVLPKNERAIKTTGFPTRKKGDIENESDLYGNGFQNGMNKKENPFETANIEEDLAQTEQVMMDHNYQMA